MVLDPAAMTLPTEVERAVGRREDQSPRSLWLLHAVLLPLNISLHGFCIAAGSRSSGAPKRAAYGMGNIETWTIVLSILHWAHFLLAAHSQLFARSTSLKSDGCCSAHEPTRSLHFKFWLRVNTASNDDGSDLDKANRLPNKKKGEKERERSKRETRKERKERKKE